jgi:hypothetical protein
VGFDRCGRRVGDQLSHYAAERKALIAEIVGLLAAQSREMAGLAGCLAMTVRRLDRKNTAAKLVVNRLKSLEA